MNQKIEQIKKIQDTFNDGSSHADTYWSNSEIQRFYRMFRKPMILPKSYFQDSNSIERVQKLYKLRGFQFGNWVTNEDRYDYLATLYICLYDLNKVLKFKDNNLGLNGTLGIALGSRGMANAKAHYEPVNAVINISRYMREDILKKMMSDFGTKPPDTIPKIARFLNTGGVGSFAHEYGHFLDSQFGMSIEPIKGQHFLTGNTPSTSKTRIEYDSKFVMRNIVEDIFEILYWKNENKTPYQIRLLGTQSKYLNQRAEVFARLFEQYIFTKLERIGIQNSFMVKNKYTKRVYLKPSELNNVIPLMDKLIVEMRKHV